MATLQVIYQIAADISQLKAGVAQGTASLDRMRAAADAFSFQQVERAVGALSNQITPVVDMAGKLTDLAAKAGMSAEAVQELDFVAKQSGSTFDAISQALAQMGNRLTEGNGGTVNAVKALGLNLDELRGMAPDQAFTAIATAIAAIPDPMQRSHAAMELFGKSGAQLLPVLTSDIESLRQRARETGLVIGNDLVKAGDDLGDSWTEVQARVDSLKAQAMLPLLSVFNEFPSSIQTVIGGVLSFLPAISSLVSAVIASGGAMTALAGLKTALLGIGSLLTLPAGLVVAAIAGLVAVFMNWDKIGPIVERVYTAVKTWLVDRFNAIVSSVREKVDAVTGFFANMYDKVVGHSYVPDMITGVEVHFARLSSVMVAPAQTATDAVMNIFGQLQQRVTGAMQPMFDAMNMGIRSAMPSVFGGSGVFSQLMQSGLGMLFGPGGIAATLAMQGMTALANVAWKGLKKIGGWFKDMFGGPSAQELAGREVVAAFENNISTMLTDAQRIEAGNDAWKQTVIFLRDSYLAMGLTEADALRDAERLWASSKNGAEAAKRVIDEIQRRYQNGITIPITYDVDPVPVLPGGDAGDPDVIPMAHGGMGRTLGPTLFYSAGNEDFAFSGEGRSFGSGDGGGIIENVIMLDGRVLARAVNTITSRQLRLQTAVGVG